MTRNAWAMEHLSSYLAGGLSTEERFEIQELAKSDATIAAALDELRGLDDRMRSLFAAAKPPFALEDRVIQSLRQKTTTAGNRGGRSNRPLVWMALAASVMLVVFAGVSAVGSLNTASFEQFVGMIPSPNLKQESLHTQDIDPAATEFDTNIAYNVDGLSFGGGGSGGNMGGVGGGMGTGTMAPYGSNIHGSVHHGRNWYEKAGTKLGDVQDMAEVLSERVIRRSVGSPEVTNKVWDRSTIPVPKKDTYPPPAVMPTYGFVSPDGGSRSSLVRKEAEKAPMPSEPSAPPSPTVAAPASVPVAPPVVTGGSSPATPYYNGPVTMSDQEGVFLGAIRPSTAEPLVRKPGSDLSFKPAEAFQNGRGEGESKGEPADRPKATEEFGTQKLERSDTAKDQKESIDDLRQIGKDNLALQDKDKDDKLNEKKPVDNSPGKTELKIEPKQPTVRRIIIRSGDIEFEVDSFDAAVTTIYKLIGQTKGGVVATTNSDKLANGKMRGTVVVRMPPEELDDFVAALRRDLGKTGELKGQRIGSQDVTKHYTDLEGELRGLRISEERLIGMLKETKAQLKDLLAVETQLAATRTKLEKIEGELRYYANLAAMSTLTIQLNEKEIRVAAGVVESERVQAGIEADDVDKAFQEAKAAIDELKGRVFRSEMKQSAAGQFNAILQFDIAPEQAGLMRDRLKQIGVVARLEVDRVQKTEGGGTANRESKIKRGDTQFFVSIYNLANVTPRESVALTVVGNDAPASYRKLRELIVKLKGNLWNTSLQNVDAQNSIGVLDFDIRRVDEPAIQAALGEAGELLSRKVERAAEGENVTDTKVRFRVRLVSVGGIQARETNNLSLVALDVPVSYRKVRDAIVKAKGHIRNANLLESDKNNITASLQFDVLRADETAMHATLQEAGDITTRRVDRRPEGETVTDAKVGFVVSMVSVASLAARETTSLTIAATDVPEAFAKLKAAGGVAKAQVRTANLNETDREDMNATFEFDVLRADEAAVATALSTLGETLSRQVDRSPAGTNVTDAKVLFKVRIVSTNAIEPRETHTLGLEVSNVQEQLKIFQALVKASGGRVISGPELGQRANGRVVARVVFDVPLAQSALLVDDVKKAGIVRVQQENKNPKAPDGKLAVARIDVTLSNADLLVPRDEGFVAQIRNGVSVSLRGLSVSASWLIVAVLFIGPWLLVIWAAFWLVRRIFGSRGEVVATSPEAAKP